MNTNFIKEINIKMKIIIEILKVSMTKIVKIIVLMENQMNQLNPALIRIKYK